jgi:hypothetical protein
VAEDLTIVERDGSETSTQYISSRMIRESYPNQDAIYDLAKRTYTHIFHERKEYFVTIEKEMRDSGEKFGQNLERRVQSLGVTMPPREQLSIEKGTDKKKIAGYDCEQYLIVDRSGQVHEEWWVAPALVSPSYFEWLKLVYAIDPVKVRVVEEMKDNGVRLGEIVRKPARVGKSKDRAAADTAQEAIEVKEGPINPSIFQVSIDGYHEIKSPYSGFVELGIERK